MTEPNKMGDETKTEISTDEYLHTVVMGNKCWHEFDFKPTPDRRRVRVFCEKCGEYCGTFATEEDFKEEDANPAYSSPDSPRRLLDEVEKVAIERFGGAAYERALITAMVDQIQGESLGAILATAPADVRCRAIRSLYEGEGK
jgi:hypothetical protein